jgi:hypothetical protein
MQIMTDVPDELFTTNPVLGLVSTPVGELLGPVNEQPAGAWTAVVLDGIDVAELSSADLPDFLAAAARTQAWARMPVEDGLLVKQAVDAYAITAKQAGDDRRVGVLRSEALTGWAAGYLTGRNVPSDGTTAGTTPRSVPG